MFVIFKEFLMNNSVKRRYSQQRLSTEGLAYVQTGTGNTFRGELRD